MSEMLHTYYIEMASAINSNKGISSLEKETPQSSDNHQDHNPQKDTQNKLSAYIKKGTAVSHKNAEYKEVIQSIFPK